MKGLIAFFLLLVSSGFAHAFGFVTAHVELVRIEQGGKGMVKFTAPIGGNPPNCVIQDYATHMSFDTNTAGGRAVYSMMLAAQTSGKRVFANGLGVCQDYPAVVESINYAHLLND